MIVRAIDSNGDWQFGRGRNDYKVDKAACEQCIGTRVRSFVGDCFFDLLAGVDWFNFLGAKNPIALDLAIRAVILGSPGVIGITKASMTVDSQRVARPNYTVDTVYTNAGIINSQIALSTSRLLDELGNILTTESGDPFIT